MYQNLSNIDRLASLTVGAGALAAGARHRGLWLQLPLLVVGSALMQRGLTGSCQVYKALGLSTAKTEGLIPTGPVRVERSVTINAAPAELYAYWRKLENLPLFMEHLVEVRQTSPYQSHWVARSPLGGVLEWDAEIVEEVQNERLVWKSLPGSDLQNGGFVTFKSAPLGMGTELCVRMQYEAPGGKLGALVARLLGEEPRNAMRDDLRRLKQLLETGEISTTQGQPVGGAA
jgi:uncharacterized membrane protein